jgi:hypothetical protein
VPTTTAALGAAFEKWTTFAPGLSPCILFGASDLTKICRVGGPVGENNFKFFIQFNGYTALYCIYLLVVMAFYVHEQKTTEV